MIKTRTVVLALLLLFALQALGRTTKNSYPVACNDLWPAVKEALSNPDDYTVVSNDDAKWTASYDVKHTVHTNISGALLQRTNKVTLVTQGTGCQMQVVSNYSGWEHNDRNDFVNRVNAVLAKQQGAAKPTEAAKP